MITVLRYSNVLHLHHHVCHVIGDTIVHKHFALYSWDRLSDEQERPGRARCAGRRDVHSEDATWPSPLDPPEGSGAFANVRGFQENMYPQRHTAYNCNTRRTHTAMRTLLPQTPRCVERAFKLIICLFLRKDGELRTEDREV